MRTTMILLVVCLMPPAVIGAEADTTLDRCVILNDAADETAESILALHFALPGDVAGKEIVSAGLYLPLSISGQDEGSLYEFRLFASTADWTEGGIDFEDAEAAADTIILGDYTIRPTIDSEFFIDISHFLKEIVAGGRTNYGIIAKGDLLGDSNVQLSGNLSQTLKSNAVVRIEYK